jgi:radical SAM superfamily enzyme YgiQ (UPF0313 family)
VKVCLIPPPSMTEFEGSVTSRAEPVRLSAGDPPLGILSLAAVLEQRGTPLEVFSLNGLFCEFVRRGGKESERTFLPLAASELLRLQADVYGFGTITSSYPLTVRLAQAVKRARPDTVVVFGGPQATAVDFLTLEAFPFIDVVVRGEAEEILPELLGALGRPGQFGEIAGITYRENGAVVRTPDAPLLPDLNQLPTPAFHLWPGIEKRRSVPLEVGRGCPFSCTFCSTSRFFRRRFRLQAPGRVIEQMRSIRQAYGIERFSLVHDAFTVVRAKVVEFCQALLESGERFFWWCSARSDCLDEELLALMAKAGCTGIFLGIESGSAQVQRAIKKNLDLDQALAAIRSADAHQVKTTVSLITGFPEETPGDLRDTVHFMMDAVRLDEVKPQFHLVAPLAGTTLYEQYRGCLKWDGVFSDMAFQGWRQDSADRALILQHPEVFPCFYAIPNANFERSYLMELRDFIIYGLARSRWLMIALHQLSGSVLEVFDRWCAWRALHRQPLRADGEYHAGARFWRDFLEFVASTYVSEDATEALAVATLLEYEAGLERLGENLPSGLPAAPVATAGRPATDRKAVPRIAPGVSLLHLSADYQRVVECLRSCRSSKDVPRRPVIVAERQTADKSVEVLQLSSLSAALLRLCDGARTVEEIAAMFPRLEHGLDQFPPEPACLFALNELARQGLLVFLPAAA